MSNTTAMIAAVENIGDALAAFGYEEGDGAWTRKPKATTETHEAKFGIITKVVVLDELTTIEGAETIGLRNELNKKSQQRYLLRTSVPLVGVKFPTDYREFDEWKLSYVSRFSDVMYLGPIREGWMCFDVQDDIVVGLEVGTFKHCFERFCNASMVQMELSYRTWMCKLGTATLADLYTQQVDRHKAFVSYERKKLEHRITTCNKKMVSGSIRIHDSLEMIAEACSDYPQNVALHEGVSYYLMYMADHTAGHTGEESSSLTANSWDNFTFGHLKQKRTHELAWAYRTVNKHKAPYAIWNPSAMLWELL